jgi:glycosyltransferase involved in cell wall biosynthesis
MEPAYAEVRDSTWRDRWAPSLHLSCRLATTTVAVSEAVRDELVDLHIPPAKVRVFHNSANLRAIHLGDRARVRTSLGYDKSHVVISTVGRAAPVKGWDTLLEAFAKVHKTLPQARLLFIGGIDRSDEREGYAELQRFVDIHGLREHVRFAGHQENIGELLSALDVFVFPSRSEGYGVALQEAFILGCACVATKVGIAPTMVVHGTNGFLVERNNPNEMAEALTTLVADQDLRQKFALAARESNFGNSMDEYGDRLYELYQSMLSGGRTPTYESEEARRRVA